MLDQALHAREVKLGFGKQILFDSRKAKSEISVPLGASLELSNPRQLRFKCAKRTSDVQFGDAARGIWNADLARRLLRTKRDGLLPVSRARVVGSEGLNEAGCILFIKRLLRRCPLESLCQTACVIQPF